MTDTRTLYIAQGADYTCDIPAVDDHNRPRLLTGWTVRGAIRHSPDSDIIHPLDVTIRPGTIRIVIPGRASRRWSWTRSQYEIQLDGPQGQRERVARGRVVLDPQLVR